MASISGKQFLKKLKQKYKSRKKSPCSWLELNNYYGCCKLSTGIYIRCFIGSILTILAVLINCFIVQRLLNALSANNTNITSLGELSLSDSSEDDLTLLYKTALFYYLFWIVFKSVYVLMILFLVYAVYQKKTTLLKIMLYSIIPSCIFDLFLSVIGSIVMPYWIQLLITVYFLSEGYNLVAVISEYQRLTGKSRILQNLEEPRVEQIYPTINNDTTQNGYSYSYTQPHCDGCTCFTNLTTNNLEVLEISTPLERPIVSIMELLHSSVTVDSPQENLDKNLNFKDVTIIFDQDQLIERNNSLVENANQEAPSSSKHLFKDTKCQSCKEEKVDLADIPVIYDENQFNVGNYSPVIEYRLD